MNGDSSYVTRGRAKELFDRMNELEQRVDERLGELEQRVDRVLAFELELAKRRIGAELEVYRLHTTTGGGQRGSGD